MLPAYAGMILVPGYHERQNDGAPRVCGDDPCAERSAPILMTVLPAYAGMIPS